MLLMNQLKKISTNIALVGCYLIFHNVIMLVLSTCDGRIVFPECCLCSQCRSRKGEVMLRG